MSVLISVPMIVQLVEQQSGNLEIERSNPIRMNNLYLKSI